MAMEYLAALIAAAFVSTTTRRPARTPPAPRVSAPPPSAPTTYAAIIAEIERMTCLRRTLKLGTPEYEANCTRERALRARLHTTPEQRRAYRWSLGRCPGRRPLRGARLTTPPPGPLEIA